MSTPFIHAFHDTSQPLSIRVERSLYTEVSNHLMMVDYASVNAPTPTPWAWEVWSQFDEYARELLCDLRCVLIHGLALQEFWLGRQEAGTSWGDLENAIASTSSDDLRQFVADSVVSGINYYRDEMPPLQRVDDLLPPDSERMTSRDLLRDDSLLRSTLQADLVSWNVPDDRLDHVLDLVLTPDTFRYSLLQLLRALWRCGSEQAWTESEAIYRPWLAQARIAIRNHQWANARDAVETITGRKPAEAEAKRVDLDAAHDVVLIPCSHLGSSQRITTVGSRHIVMFEPSRSAVIGTATDQPVLSEAVNLLRAITDGPAFSLVQSLALGDEKYALQLADDAQIHQSTVSRHLAMLERAGAVEVRPEGKAKYYRLDTDRIRTALTVISQAITLDTE
ncbi:MAG: helix-turn-helix transcriptional regulator [Thermomicrobiales bacterium]|nr:helix-turn-helix transcriptional regulator [Thermomicrobiales bacterium]